MQEGTEVNIIAGPHSGNSGTVMRVIPSGTKVLVEFDDRRAMVPVEYLEEA